MFRFSLRSLVGLTTVIAIIAAGGFYFSVWENPVERDIRLYGKIPMKEPDRLFAEVERLAKLGDDAQSGDFFGYIPADASKLSRVELAQIAYHYRKQFPLVSLRSRLAYESSAAKRKSTLPKATLERMRLAEDPSKGGTVKARFTPVRTQALNQLHSEWVFHFITQEGVGFSRMRFPSVWDLELADSPVPDFDTISDDAPNPGAKIKVPNDEPGSYHFEQEWEQFDKDHYQNGVRLAFNAWSEKHNPLSIPTRPRLAWFYEQDRLEFGESGRNGYAKDLDHVSGFAPHRLASIHTVKMDRPSGNFGTEPVPAERHWTLKTLQLVSLLKYDRPQVYASKKLPNMESLGSELRDLDTFEQMSLQNLYEGEDLCIEGRENQIRMVGSLRAVQQCLDCHTVDRGELLGAFTYEFVRNAPLQTAGKQL